MSLEFWNTAGYPSPDEASGATQSLRYGLLMTEGVLW